MKIRLWRWMIRIERITPVLQARERMDTRGYRIALDEKRQQATQKLREEVEHVRKSKNTAKRKNPRRKTR